MDKMLQGHAIGGFTNHFGHRFGDRSETIDKLAKALIQFQSEVPCIKKDALNPHFGSAYADLSGIIETIKPTLTKHKFAVIQRTCNDVSDVASIQTVLLHESGEYISGFLNIKAKKDDAQGVGSAITYARRYGLASLLGIAPDDDDDGNEAVREEREAPKKNGFDPTDIVLVKKMEQLLTKKEVDKAHWPKIMEKMAGKSAKEVDEVIAEVVGGKA